MKEDKYFAPITLEMKVWMINDDGDIAKATCDIGVGNIPTKEVVKDLINQSLEVAEKQGFKLCSPSEFMERIMYENTGEHMTIGGCQSDWSELEEI